LEPSFLRRALRRAAAASFNMVTVDGDTSTNDTLLLLANGQAGNRPIRGEAEGRAFLAALEEVCIFLARCIARDGEGATKLMEVTVEGAQTQHQARVVARTVAGSPLVKAALHGNDPNWGRILAAAGRSGAKLVEGRTDLYLQGHCLMKGGRPQLFDKAEASASLNRAEVSVRVCLNLGRGRATAWGCDLSEEYVTFNSAYTT
ncbi:MAG: bifunctional ornithine acetyltransferase/N-acetylglutamate synthase, partial [Chloroflexota bacterium]|nr:bifunctional ornithine acetyltransferase/N-acetylglutamate synthase [Chloroflexota bacterium]